MRRLATVRQVSQVLPIEGADLIELAITDGWQCVIRKGSFLAGDLAIYCEVDTVLPVLPQYEFLRKGCYVQRDWLPNGEGFRLRTIRLRNQISQGLLLPLTDTSLEEGMDVSDTLGIIKWEPPLHAGLAGMAKGNFPTFIHKTDQERVQNIAREVFSDMYQWVLWEATLKLDGSSCTFYHRDGEVGVCSRNINLKLDQSGNAYVNMYHELDMGTKLLGMGRNIAIQGELMGPGIQGNREKLPRQQFYCFDVWDIDNQRYLPKRERDHIIEATGHCVHDRGLELVPVLGVGTLGELGCNTLDNMLRYVDRPSMNHKVAEGVVFKAIDVPYSFKCINNKYLLAED